MSKRKVVTRTNETFGQRMARIRQKKGYSQRDLAAETGISQRMIAYYESQSEYPPTHILPVIAKVLEVSSDQLLGMEKIKSNLKTKDNRLWRRFHQIEKLDQIQRRQIIQVLDTYIEREQLKKHQQ